MTEQRRFQDELKLAAGRVEAFLDVSFASLESQGTPVRLAAAMRHAVLGGGKRFRPFLVQETSALLGGPLRPAVAIGAALECVHCYSLVHDDLPAMDNDSLRRGRPTVWKAFDEWTAILAGDALLTLGFDIVAETGGLDAATRLTIVGGLARGAGHSGMVGGQMLDLEAEKLGQPSQPSLDHIRRLQAMKTGALIRFACEAGARVAGAGVADLRRIVGYGEALGRAFQIADDLLDVSGNEAAVGKAVGKDAALGKATVVGLLGEPAARQKLRDTVDEAIGSLHPFGGRAEALKQAAASMLTRDR